MSRDTSYRYCGTEAELGAFCTEIRSAPWIALDTEFVRDRTYFPKLCLLQIATPDVIACIDPISCVDLAPLLEILFDPAVIKVVHAARQDLEIFYCRYNKVPPSVFDTQLAAPLLGNNDQISYSALVEQYLGVQLDKGQSRSDWVRRPLSDAQLAYAADDVRYLAELYPLMLAQLTERGRLGWLDNDFAALTSASTYANPPAEAWRRVKGIEHLNDKSFGRAQVLAEWREETAVRLDKPRGWVLKDIVLTDVAKSGPTTLAELETLRGLPARFCEQHGNQLLVVLARASEKPTRSQSRRVRRPNPHESALIDALMAFVKACGARHDIHPSQLTSRSEVERLVVEPAATSRVLQGWRAAVVGDELQLILQGKLEIVAGHSGIRTIAV